MHRTTGFKRFLSGLGKVVLGDIGGAITGAAVGFGSPVIAGMGAIIGSITAASILIEESQNSDTRTSKIIYDGRHVNNLIPTRLSDLYLDNANDGMGYVHNTIIIDLHKEYGHQLFDFTEKELYNIILPKLLKLYPDPIMGIHKHSLLQRIPKVKEALKLESVEDYLIALKAINPNVALEIEVLEIFADGLNNITSNEEVTCDYYDEFRMLVVGSLLPMSSKITIQQSISVGAGSNILWQIQ